MYGMTPIVSLYKPRGGSASRKSTVKGCALAPAGPFEEPGWKPDQSRLGLLVPTRYTGSGRTDEREPKPKLTPNSSDDWSNSPTCQSVFSCAVADRIFGPKLNTTRSGKIEAGLHHRRSLKAWLPSII